MGSFLGFLGGAITAVVSKRGFYAPLGTTLGGGLGLLAGILDKHSKIQK